jgi:outer membrane usher protein FimD/PapC
MLTKPCVLNKRLSFLLLFCVLACRALALPPNVTAAETIIVNILLNSEKKGERFVTLTDDGDFLLRKADLEEMGLATAGAGSTVSVAGEPCLSLRSFPGITFHFDDKTLTLAIDAHPSLLGARVIDLLPQRPTGILYPRDTAAFFNYRLDYATGDALRFRSASLTGEAGFRSGYFVLLSDGIYRDEVDTDRFTRLASRLVYDRRDDLVRVTAGDLATSSGELGTAVVMGGVSIAKLYQINPYLIYHPPAGLSGLTPLASDLEIYLDGIKVRSEKIPAGRFTVKDLPVYGGAGELDVVVRDAFGREKRYSRPFYATDTILRGGLHEYSYSAGVLREGVGTESNRYDRPAFSFFHRYGITDEVNLGARGEGTAQRGNVGLLADYARSAFGILSVSLAGSYGGSGGAAVSLSHTCQGRTLSSRVTLKAFSREFSTLMETDGLDRLQYEAGGSVGYGTRQLGTLTCDVTAGRSYAGVDRLSAGVSYSRSLMNSFSLFAQFRQVRDTTDTSEFSVGISYYPDRDHTLSTIVRQRGSDQQESIQFQKNLPLGEGTGYLVQLDREATDASSSYRINPTIQYNATHAAFSADYAAQSTNGRVTDATRLSVAGAVVYAGNSVGVTRPVTDSFALVKVGDVAGVRVIHNGLEIGRTDDSGKIFVPTLNEYYDNQVAIKDSDIPIDYALSSNFRYISPPYRSGSCLFFDAARIQAFTGILAVRENGKVNPLKFNEVTIMMGGKPLTIQTGSGGEFYFDNTTLKTGGGDEETGCAALTKGAGPAFRPGVYRATVIYGGMPLPFEIAIPSSDAPFVDLGTIICPLPAVPVPATVEHGISAVPSEAPTPRPGDVRPYPPE